MNTSNTSKQYMFHFDYPVDSIDIRSTTDVEKEWIFTLIFYYDKFVKGPLFLGYTPRPDNYSNFNYKQAYRIATELYPEELI